MDLVGTEQLHYAWWLTGHYRFIFQLSRNDQYLVYKC